MMQKKYYLFFILIIAAVFGGYWLVKNIRVTYTNEIYLVDPPVVSELCSALNSKVSVDDILHIINSDPDQLLLLSKPIEFIPKSEMDKILKSNGALIFPSEGPVELLPLEYAIRFEMCDKIAPLLSIDGVYSADYLLEMMALCIDNQLYNCLPPFLHVAPDSDLESYLNLVQNLLEKHQIDI